MLSWIRAEPAIFFGLIQAVLTAALNVVLAFGLSVSADQVAAINGVVLAISALVLSLVTRSKVTPV